MYCSIRDMSSYCNVTIEISGTLFSIIGNGSFDGLASNTLYPVVARAINRCGDYSEARSLQWTCKALCVRCNNLVHYCDGHISTRGSTHCHNQGTAVNTQWVC